QGRQSRVADTRGPSLGRHRPRLGSSSDARTAGGSNRLRNMNPRSRNAAIVFALILILITYALASAQAPDRSSAASAVRSFYTFHLAHKKDFTAANIRLRRPWLTPEFYALFLGEFKRQAEYSKAHP